MIIDNQSTILILWDMSKHGGETEQGSHFFGLTKFHDISMIFPGF